MEATRRPRRPLVGRASRAGFLAIGANRLYALLVARILTALTLTALTLTALTLTAASSIAESETPPPETPPPEELCRKPEDAPQLILIGAKIVTVDDRFTIAKALAVHKDRFVRVGSTAEVMALKGPATRIVDLQGKMVLPGLIDSHVHPGSASMHEFDHPVPDLETIAEVLAYVRSRAAAVAEGEWIWVQQVFITRLKEQRFPTKEELDQAAPLHPVVFSTGPDAMANSRALKLSGIDANFQAPGAGQIMKDPNTGVPTGMLRGGTKRFLKGSPAATRASEEQRLQRLELLLRDYNSVGITSIADRDAGESEIDRYEALRRTGRLTTRVAVSHSVDASGSTEQVREAIQKVASHPLRQPSNSVRIVGVKTYLDGGMLTGSALMREPWGVSSIYGIEDPEYRGVRFIDSEKLVAIVRETAAAGMQFTAHSVGDGAVHALLDAYREVSREMPIRHTRPCITHCNFLSAEAIDFMRELGAVADIQPIWLYLDARTLSAQFGEARLSYFQPLRALFESGVNVGGGSDHMQKVGSFRAINPYNPFLGMKTAVSRRARGLDRPVHIEQALTRAQAIAFYTRNNAHLLFLDEQIGTIESGKLADFVVLDRDLLECDEDAIQDTQVVATYLDGMLVAGRLD